VDKATWDGTFCLMSLNGGGTSLHPNLPLANIPSPQGNMLTNPTNMITPLIDPTPRAKY